MPSRPSPAPGSSRNRLLHSAKRLFTARGYEQTATSAIAREAGTSESQLMRYFGGKAGLLDALFNDAWSDLGDRVREATAGSPSPREALLRLLETLATALQRDQDLAALFLFEGRRLRGGKPRVRLPEGFQALVEAARSLVRKAQAAHEIDARLDAAAVTAALVGACEAMVRERLLARSAGSRAFSQREIMRTLESMLAGFAGRSARPAKPVKPARPVRHRAAS
jgi:AcrR family transcriptional regulator